MSKKTVDKTSARRSTDSKETGILFSGVKRMLKTFKTGVKCFPYLGRRKFIARDAMGFRPALVLLIYVNTVSKTLVEPFEKHSFTGYSFFRVWLF